MSSPINGGKRQSISTSRLANNLPVELPFSQWLVHKRLLPTPGHLKCPTFVADPVTDPVVCSNIDKRVDSTLEEFRNVSIRGVIFVLSTVKCISDGITAGAEV